MRYKIIYNERIGKYKVKYKLWIFWLTFQEGSAYDEIHWDKRFDTIEEAREYVKDCIKNDKKNSNWEVVEMFE